MVNKGPGSFEENACAAHGGLAALQRGWSGIKKRSFNHVLCRTSKAAFEGHALPQYEPGVARIVVAQGGAGGEGGFDSNDGTTAFWKHMSVEQQQSGFKTVKNFQSKRKVLNITVRSTVSMIPSYGVVSMCW